MSAHFSFTKSLYDNCNLKKKDEESTGAFKWITDTVYEHKDSCNVDASPFMHNQFKSIPAKAVDIENDLRNQTRLLSRCPESRFDPSKVTNDNKFTSKLENCKSNNLVPEYTRVNKPCNIFSGISINRLKIYKMSIKFNLIVILALIPAFKLRMLLVKLNKNNQHVQVQFRYLIPNHINYKYVCNV